MKLVEAKVSSNEKVLPGVGRSRRRSLAGTWLMRLNAAEIARAARPGQFIMAGCENSTLPRPLSIHQVNQDDISLFYTVWEEGRGTVWMSKRQANDTVRVFGPLGNGFSVRPDAKNLLLVAGGIGIAPLCYLAGQAVAKGKQVWFLTGAATKAQIGPPGIIPNGVGFACATEDGTLGKQGLVTELIPEHAAWADQVFACGPLPMYRALAARRRELGLEGKPVQVSLEMRMACGVGVCYGCTVNTKRGLRQVCKDGPVFELGDIVWEELAEV